jgi:hypothetical protein
LLEDDEEQALEGIATVLINAVTRVALSAVYFRGAAESRYI